MSSVYFLSQSTLGRSQLMNSYINKSRAEMEIASQELATGRKFDVAADLGMKSSEAYELRSVVARNERFIQANKLTDNKLEFQAEIMNTIRDEVQDVLNLAVGNVASPNGTAQELQREAGSALSRMIAALNNSIDGEHLFSGLDSQNLTMTGYGATHPVTGFSPSGVVDGITGGTVVSAADAAAKIAELQSIFDSSNAVIPTRNYEDTFFNGTDLSVGQRRVAVVGDNDTVEYGVQANDPAFYEMYQGLAMLTSVDVSTIADPAGYRAYMDEAVGKLASGIDKLTEQQAKLGKDRQAIDEKIDELYAENDVLTYKVNNLETVDPYEAASRLSAFELQLEATYSATARLNQLSFLSYMR